MAARKASAASAAFLTGNRLSLSGRVGERFVDELSEVRESADGLFELAGMVCAEQVG